MIEPKVYSSNEDGHRAWAILWDGSEESAVAIKTMTNERAAVNQRGVLGYIVGATRRHIPIGHWVTFRRDVVPMNRAQFELLYTEVPPPPAAIITEPAAS